jgi:sulfite exporter TauE/SafE
MIQYNYYITIFSLFNLGFFGGFSHCIGMCGPFVLTQVSSRLQKTSLDEFSYFTRLKNLALLPYHFGRITTYSIIGFCSSFIVQNITGNKQFKLLSAILLIFAALFFLNLCFNFTYVKAKANKFKNLLNFWLPFRSQTNKNSGVFWCNLIMVPLKIVRLIKTNLSNLISDLFKDPKGLNGYLLGVMLGFIPCGLLYGAFALSATIKSPFLAAFAMMIFGFATIPSLFASAIGGYSIFKIKYLDLKLISKIIILINSLTLFMIAASLIKSII